LRKSTGSPDRACDDQGVRVRALIPDDISWMRGRDDIPIRHELELRLDDGERAR
jgi:hypothetical protein